MASFQFYLTEMEDDQLRQILPYPLPFKRGKWSLFTKFIYSTKPEKFVCKVQIGCCFCQGNIANICMQCEKKMMHLRDKAIISLTIDKMINACILLRAAGLINDIIHYIIIDLHVTGK